MIGSLALFVTLFCLSNVAGQPVFCKEDAQCPEGFFCEADAHNCRECLRCQDLKRKPPFLPSVDQCVKSVAECGDCYDGLELDRRRGDVNAECVAGASAGPVADRGAEGASHTWLYVIVALVAVALVLGVLIVLLLRRDIFKTAGSGQNSVTATITATAPEAPPPYNALPADSPGPYYTGNGHAGPYDEDQHPFIAKANGSAGQRREAAGSQAARVYEQPFYMRDHQPPSPVSSPVSDADETAFFPEEETTESVWTPQPTLANGDGNTKSEPAEGASGGAGGGGGAAGAGAGSLSLQLAAARRTDLVDASPAKKMRVAQDSNNNRNHETNAGTDSESCPQPPSPGHAGHGAHGAHGTHAPPGAPPYNFTTQIINVVQFNANK